MFLKLPAPNVRECSRTVVQGIFHVRLMSIFEVRSLIPLKTGHVLPLAGSRRWRDGECARYPCSSVL
jgi:hypothetical protein